MTAQNTPLRAKQDGMLNCRTGEGRNGEVILACCSLGSPAHSGGTPRYNQAGASSWQSQMSEDVRQGQGSIIFSDTRQLPSSLLPVAKQALALWWRFWLVWLGWVAFSLFCLVLKQLLKKGKGRKLFSSFSCDCTSSALRHRQARRPLSGPQQLAGPFCLSSVCTPHGHHAMTVSFLFLM